MNIKRGSAELHTYANLPTHTLIIFQSRLIPPARQTLATPLSFISLGEEGGGELGTMKKKKMKKNRFASGCIVRFERPAAAAVGRMLVGRLLGWQEWNGSQRRVPHTAYLILETAFQKLLPIRTLPFISIYILRRGCKQRVTSYTGRHGMTIQILASMDLQITD